jgi:PTH1 family peptidyl-tRNA hydrolase
VPAADRWLIVGLGNPGPEYSHNRHNVGYWVVNRLARLNDITIKAKSLATIGSGEVRGVEVVLLKPRTYMNLSGNAVGPAMKQNGISPQHVVIIYDELDLPMGRIRIKANGGSGGHNGIKSIIGAVGSSDFPRIRIGIGRPHVDGEPTWESEHVSPWVLGNPTPEQAKTLQDAVSRTCDAVEMMLVEGVEAAMNRYNK